MRVNFFFLVPVALLRGTLANKECDPNDDCVRSVKNNCWFCDDFTAGEASIPSWLGQFADTRISSACSCIGCVSTSTKHSTSSTFSTRYTTSSTWKTLTTTSSASKTTQAPSTCPSVSILTVTATSVSLSTITAAPATATVSVTDDITVTVSSDITLPAVTSYITLTSDITTIATDNITLPAQTNTVTATATEDVTITATATDDITLPPQTDTVTATATENVTITATATDDITLPAQTDTVTATATEDVTITTTATDDITLPAQTNTVTATATEDVTITATATDDITLPAKTNTVTATATEDVTLTSLKTLPASTVTVTETAVLICSANTAVPNAIQNPGFESGALSPWVFGSNPTDPPPAPPTSYSINTAHPHSGSYAIFIFDNEGSQYDAFRLYQQVSVCPGRSYTFSFWAFALQSQFCFLQSFFNGADGPPFQFALGTSYQQFSATFVVPPTATSVSIGIEDTNCFGNFYADDFSFSAAA